MYNDVADPRRSRQEGWKLVVLTLVVIAVLFAVFDLAAQIRIRTAVRDLARAASQSLLQRPAPRPNYRRVRQSGEPTEAARP